MFCCGTRPLSQSRIKIMLKQESLKLLCTIHGVKNHDNSLCRYGCFALNGESIMIFGESQ